LEKRITRRKGKPKKFENLSEIDIDEKRKVANIQERKRMKKLSKALDVSSLETEKKSLLGS
jgi:hypothetical protein